MAPTVVVAVITAAPGREDEFAQRLTHVAECSQQEPGVLSYSVHRVPDTAQYVLVEAYASREAFNEHLATEHVSSFMAQFDDLTIGEPQILQTQPLPIGDPAKRLT